MPIDIQPVPYGTPALKRLTEIVTNTKGNDPLAPVTVIVPRNFVGITARRHLARQFGGVIAVEFVTIGKLAQQLGAARLAGQGMRPAPPLAVAQAVRSVLESDPGYFTAVAGHPSTERSLIRAHQEFTKLDTAALDELSQGAQRTADVVRIHRLAKTALNHQGFSDERDLIKAAISELESNTAKTSVFGTMIVYLPQRLAGIELTLVQKLAESVQLTVIAAMTGVDDADETVVRTLKGLDPSWQAVSSNQNSEADIEVISASDADDEVRHAIRQLIDAIRHSATPSRCGILYGTSVPYARLITDMLDAAGITRSGVTTKTAATCWLGRALLGLLDLAVGNFSRTAVMNWLNVAQPQLPDGSTASLAEWERIAREARVDIGLANWQARLTTFATDRQNAASEISKDEENEWLIERYQRQAANANQLVEFATALHELLTIAESGNTWAEWVSWCQQLIATYLDNSSATPMPADEADLAKDISTALEEIANLDHATTSKDSPSTVTLPIFRRALQGELERLQPRGGKFGTGVFVGPLSQGVGMDFDLVLICGLAEGTLPARPREDVLLPDNERRPAPDLELRSERTGNDHRYFLAALASAQKACLLYPRGDLRRTSERMPSRWLVDIAEAKLNKRITPSELARESGDWHHEVPSFISGIRHADFGASVQEHDMHLLLNAHDSATTATQSRLADQEHAWSRVLHAHEARSKVAQAAAQLNRSEVTLGAQLMLARFSSDFTRFDGNLSHRDARQDFSWPYPGDGTTITSASKLESWMACPYQYFVRNILKVNEIDEPETMAISSLDFGSLIHDILYRWLTKMIQQNAQKPATEKWADEEQACLKKTADERLTAMDNAGRTGRLFHRERTRRLVEDTLDRFIEFDNAHRVSYDIQPEAAELSFGMSHSLHPPVTIEFTDGTSIEMRGSIDRLDRTKAGNLVVIDYKTGRAPAKNPNMSAPDGGRFQIVLYDEAARRLAKTGSIQPVADNAHQDQDLGIYWYMSPREDSIVDHPYEMADAREPVMKNVATIVAMIKKGVFVMRPQQPGDWGFGCAYCTPDGSTSRPQWLDWKRLAEQPEITAINKLVSPDNDDDDDADDNDDKGSGDV